MKTIVGVPESITRAQYLGLIESVGFDVKELQSLEFKADGIYAVVAECNEAGHWFIDPGTDELVTSRVFIPVRDD